MKSSINGQLPFQTELWPASCSHSHHCLRSTAPSPPPTLSSLDRNSPRCYYILHFHWGSKVLCESPCTCCKWRSLNNNSQETFWVQGQAQVYLPRWTGINRFLRLKAFPSFTLIAGKLRVPQVGKLSSAWSSPVCHLTPAFSLKLVAWFLLLLLFVFKCICFQLLLPMFLQSTIGNCMSGQHDKNLKAGGTVFHR